jgi:hypothetical protein
LQRCKAFFLAQAKPVVWDAFHVQKRHVLWHVHAAERCKAEAGVAPLLAPGLQADAAVGQASRHKVSKALAHPGHGAWAEFQPLLYLGYA